MFLNDKKIAAFNISTYGTADPNPYIPGGTAKGSALGPWQDQAS